MPTLTQLEYIVSVDQFRHFGRASTDCHVSQPSLSMQIQKVEEELGITLFDRAKKPIFPTEAGSVFIEQAKAVLREHKKLLNLSRQSGAELSGDFRLGIIPTLAPYVIPLFVEDFSRTYPKVNLQIDELKTDAIVLQLKEDRIDAGILATPLHETGIRERILFYEAFHLYVGSKHPLQKRARVSEDDLDGSEMWLLQDGHCLRNQVVKFCSIKGHHGVFRNVQFEGGNLETLRYLVKTGHGYTLVPRLFVDTLSAPERAAHVRDFSGRVPTREVSLVYRRDQYKSGILDGLETLLKNSIPVDLRSSFDKKKELLL